MSVYHIPVMASECVEYLNLRPGGVYVDATLGAGGHALAMLEACAGIRLYGFDRDAEAIQEANTRLKGADGRCELIQAPFSSLRSRLALRKIPAIDGILFDLGVSSHQLDEAARGFSFDRDAALDMRMDRGQMLSAATLLNASDPRELARIIWEYGEELSAGKIARAIEKARAASPLKSTAELARVIESVAGSGTRDSLKTKLRVFQAIRIAVNSELIELRSALHDAIMMLRPGGRAVVLSYHSLEDRIVKNMFRDAAKGCHCPPRQMLCTCHQKPGLKVLTGRPITASEEEIQANPRSRSAKLRAAEKLPEWAEDTERKRGRLRFQEAQSAKLRAAEKLPEWAEDTERKRGRLRFQEAQSAKLRAAEKLPEWAEDTERKRGRLMIQEDKERKRGRLRFQEAQSANGDVCGSRRLRAQTGTFAVPRDHRAQTGTFAVPRLSPIHKWGIYHERKVYHFSVGGGPGRVFQFLQRPQGAHLHPRHGPDGKDRGRRKKHPHRADGGV